MDLKAIEAELVQAKTRANEWNATVRGTTSDRLHGTLFTSACENIGVLYLDDLLRLVRAMAFIEANEPELFRSSLTSKWICDGETGDTMINAIEAAMMADTGTESKQPRASRRKGK